MHLINFEYYLIYSISLITVTVVLYYVLQKTKENILQGGYSVSEGNHSKLYM